ncbi:MAG: hypothetical protein MUC88_17790, partial [Planctomycetes bacterium]|nr:hypothetical protein [Planctomycetota bacterium]
MMGIRNASCHQVLQYSRIPVFHSARGSALILAVVLTSLLAMVGVLFMMTSRIDKMATSATTDNQELSLAVETVVAQLSEALAQDVPGVGRNQEYYDYPDVNNPWLAAWEPMSVQAGTNADGSPKFEYRWPQISNLGGLSPAQAQNVRLRIVGEREPIVPGDPNANADPDGDGVGDAKWVAVPGVMSGKGRPIYAAVRVVDNGGMLNVNTGYRFDPGDTDPNRVDGSSPLQVNLLALGKTGDPLSTREAGLRSARAANLAAALDLATYERQVVWRYPGEPEPNQALPYTPFDLSDELELR